MFVLTRCFSCMFVRFCDANDVGNAEKLQCDDALNAVVKLEMEGGEIGKFTWRDAWL